MGTILEYKCPNCGGTISFDSDTQEMKCPYCEGSFTLETLKKYDEMLNSQPADEINWQGTIENDNNTWHEGDKEGVILYSCSSCGGEIIGDKNTAASICPFCGSTAIMTGALSGDIKPDLIIPFKVNKESAIAALKKHVSSFKLVPNLFKRQNQLEKITGMYVPFWLFDCDVNASIRYKATKTSIWSDPKYRYTDTKHYALLRQGEVSFQKVPIDGSSKIDNALMQSIEPFNYDEAVDFQSAYLSGYFADRYDVSKEDSIPEINERIKTSTAQQFMPSTISYDSCTIDQANIQLNHSKTYYSLLPVWFLNTQYKGKNYIFAMNGQTGKFIGDLPTSKAKARGWFAGIALGLFAIAAILSYFFLGGWLA